MYSWRAVSQQSNINMIHRVSKTEEENHIIISMEAEKSVDKSQNLFMIKSVYKLEIEGNSTNLIKAVYENPQLTSDSVVNG